MPPKKASTKTAAAPKTPVKGKKRALSDDEQDAPKTPANKKQNKDAAIRTPQRPDGRAYVVPVDPFSNMITTHQVYVDASGEVYDAMLNQTNVGGNNNKFYVLQLLHPKGDASQITLYTRWGRVGENGASQSKGPFPPSEAKKNFAKQFKSKTGADYSKRTTMVPKSGKYTWLEKAYDDDDAPPPAEPGSPVKKPKSTAEVKIPDSKYPLEVQNLINFMFNQDFMKAHLMALNYDINKQPLGKLGASTVTNGFNALKQLAEVIADMNGPQAQSLGGFQHACEQLTNRYYTVIPHAFGRQRPLIIRSEEQLKMELDLVGSLGDMETATKIIASGLKEKEVKVNPIDEKLASLKLKDITVVDKSSPEFQGITMYAGNTNESINGQSCASDMEVLQAFRIEREGEEERWMNSGWGTKYGDGDRLLLWHGSRTTNFVGIISQGLRIAPPEAPVTGYEFGKGVYFGDMLGISANYTHARLSSDIGLLLLCEVVAKPFHEAYEFDTAADQTSKKNGKVVTKALGKMQHEEWIDAGEKLGRDDLKGVLMPGGRAKDLSSTFPRPSVKVEDIWNEYIAYDVAQIRIRYLLQIRLKNWKASPVQQT